MIPKKMKTFKLAVTKVQEVRAKIYNTRTTRMWTDFGKTSLYSLLSAADQV